MSSPKLGRYLRAYRKGSGLTAKDVATLLGFGSGGIISRAETGNGMPPVSVLLGYCILFDVHPKDLVPGIFRDMEKSVQARAQVLAGQLEKRQLTPPVQARIRFLDNLSQSYGEAEAIRRDAQFNQNGIPQTGAGH